jgi:hypothetical protein
MNNRLIQLIILFSTIFLSCSLKSRYTGTKAEYSSPRLEYLENVKNDFQQKNDINDDDALLNYDQGNKGNSNLLPIGLFALAAGALLFISNKNSISNKKNTFNNPIKKIKEENNISFIDILITVTYSALSGLVAVIAPLTLFFPIELNTKKEIIKDKDDKDTIIPKEENIFFKRLKEFPLLVSINNFFENTVQITQKELLKTLVKNIIDPGFGIFILVIALLSIVDNLLQTSFASSIVSLLISVLTYLVLIVGKSLFLGLIQFILQVIIISLPLVLLLTIIGFIAKFDQKSYSNFVTIISAISIIFILFSTNNLLGIFSTSFLNETNLRSIEQFIESIISLTKIITIPFIEYVINPILSFVKSIFVTNIQQLDTENKIGTWFDSLLEKMSSFKNEIKNELDLSNQSKTSLVAEANPVNVVTSQPEKTPVAESNPVNADKPSNQSETQNNLANFLNKLGIQTNNANVKPS